jgi:hypothetical protein
MEIKKVSLSLFVMLVLLLSLNLTSAITGSIGNAKMILYPEVNGWTTTTIERSILVRNVNNVSVDISLEANDEGKEFLEIIDNKFTLVPGEEKKAQFIVKVKEEKDYEGRINVFFSPIESDGPGVVLSSTIIVIAAKDQENQNYYQNDEDEEIEEDDIDTNIEYDKENSGKSKAPLFLIIGNLILLMILIALIIIINKSKKRKKSGDNKKNNYRKK